MHGDERRAHGHLGLAETDVATDQAVHRFGREHVLAHRLDGALLIRRFLEREAGTEGFVIGLRVPEGIALAGGAACIDVEQLGGDVAHLFGGLALGLLPGFRAQAVQRCQGVVAAGVAGDQVQAGHRHVELGFLGIHQGEEFGGLAVELHGHQAQVAADAMVDMHHRRAFAQLGEVLDHVVAGIAGLFAAAALHDALAEQRAFGDQRDIGELQALIERRDGDAQTLLARAELRPAFDFFGLELEAREQFEQHLAAPGGLGAEQHAARVFLDEAAQGGQWFAGLGLDRQVGQGAGLEARAADARLDVFRADHHPRPVLQAGEAVLDRQEDVGGWQQRPLGIDATFLVAVARIGPELFRGLLDTG